MTYWNNLANQRKFINWAGKELGIKDMEDWYKVSAKVEGSLSWECKKNIGIG